MLDNITRGLLNGVNLLYEWAGLEKNPVMIDGGGADSGGPNALPHGSHTWSPGSDNTPAALVFHTIKRPAGKPWDNLYLYNTLTRTPQPFVYAFWELEFALTDSDLKGNAREFEIELCEAGWTYNMAWQYKWSHVDGPPAWRLFDQTAVSNKWVPMPNIPPPAPKPGVFVDIQAFFAIDRANGVTYHDSIIIDGMNYPINLAHRYMHKWSPNTNYLHNAVQIDSLGDGAACGIQIRKWNVRGI